MLSSLHAAGIPVINVISGVVRVKMQVCKSRMQHGHMIKTQIRTYITVFRNSIFQIFFEKRVFFLTYPSKEAQTGM
jgi:hypothetical protein